MDNLDVTGGIEGFLLLHEKLLQFDWLCENYIPFAGSSINK